MSVKLMPSAMAIAIFGLTSGPAPAQYAQPGGQYSVQSLPVPRASPFVCDQYHCTRTYVLWTTSVPGFLEGLYRSRCSQPNGATGQQLYPSSRPGSVWGSVTVQCNVTETQVKWQGG